MTPKQERHNGGGNATLAIFMSKTVIESLKKDAAARGISTSAHAANLMNAAWAARHGETGDRDLDATVAAALILHGSGMDFEAIARALKCSEDMVEKIVGAWASLVEDKGGFLQ